MSRFEELAEDSTLIREWRKLHDNPQETAKAAAIKQFASMKQLSEDDVRQIAYLARRPISSEQMRYWVTEFLVNQVYGITEEPWDGDYEAARELSKMVLGYCLQNRRFYDCPCDYSKIVDSKAFADLGSKQAHIEKAVIYARTWMKNR